MKQIARLIKQFQLKSKIFHFDYAHRGSNTHKHQLDKKKKETENQISHVCMTRNRLVYFRLSKAKRSQKFGALKLHFLSLGRDRLTAPAPSPYTPPFRSSCPELWKWVCSHRWVSGSPIHTAFGCNSKLPGCLGRFAWVHGTCKVTCMSAPLCGSVHGRVCFHGPAKRHQLQHQHQNRH